MNRIKEKLVLKVEELGVWLKKIVSFSIKVECVPSKLSMALNRASLVFPLEN